MKTKACVWVVSALMGLSLLGSPSLGATSLGSLTITAIKARIFTPNGDGFNDKARFEFDNPEMLAISGSVYDVTGSRVADLQPGSDPFSVMLWDGKDSGGSPVPGGIYIYQIEYQGKKATGTVIVSR